MLEVRCEDYLTKVRAFADSRGPGIRRQLEAKLTYLEQYRDGTCLCDLYRDLAPHSFGFTIYGPAKADGERDHWLTGGLIFYEPRQSGVGGPQFSVSLSGATGLEGEQPRWEIHT